ncbi:MAG: transcription-repair coupling factor [Rhodospirillales bacterium]
MELLTKKLERPGRLLISGAPEGFDALLLAEFARDAGTGLVFVARDDVRLARMAEALAFFAPGTERLEFPAWDCLPYDRVSPNGEIVSRRIDTLTRLLEAAGDEAAGRVVLTTVSALLQRVPPRAVFAGATLHAARGRPLDPEALVAFLAGSGYVRSATVMEPGEYAVRGGIVDVFPPGRDEPVRLDFFGDELEGIRAFDPVTQRTTGTLRETALKPVSEMLLDEAAIARFRSGYRVLFGAPARDDPLYEAVSAGRRHMGMEHWLPLFHERLETLLDYVPGWALILDHQAEAARDARLDLIAEYYAARTTIAGTGLAAAGTIYNPVPPDRLYLDGAAWDTALESRSVGLLSPFGAPAGQAGAVDAGGRPGRDFGDARAQPGVNVFDALRDHVAAEREAGRRVVIAAFTRGARDRLGSLLTEHGVANLREVDGWAGAAALGRGAVALAVVGLERGFTAPGLAVIAEQDILGDRLTRPARRKVRPEAFIAEAASLQQGDLVVHVDHGVGRYDGLDTLQVAGAPHDCLRLIYDGGDKLFLPVENIEVISRYGSEQAEAQLDRLGGAAWQARKARLKKRIRDMAEALIAVAAARSLRPGAVMTPPEGQFDEFCARFPYAETEDQQNAIADIVTDLGGGRPVDRLICGDVGFGKTEVALRAAFITAFGGKQVAVVVPTTLLCRQHYHTFSERFADLPVRVAQISRLVSGARVREAKAGLADGTVDIVIGTHALLAKDIRFRDLGLLVVDEEQHFGVAHKEKLKKLKADVHVLTLTATPIPRTLQMALSGVREMSLIATPPVDRLAVRTFVLPFDPVVVREAILREHYRGGQTFYVCPRIEDLDALAARLGDLVPEVKMVMAHGRMAARQLEAAMAAFYDRAFDLLLSTNIIESGLDLPAVNTIVIHRADMFGLAQLYQLRGRVGRSKVRAYAYLTLPPRQKLSPAAEKRLDVMQTLDTLGAGFSLASHDLDIRGAGNLLGAEQSGHIREVGIELYQQMLEEAVAQARGSDGAADGEWSPQISIGMPVRIPEDYVADLTVRLGLYRRIAGLRGAEEIDAFAAELIDRFGALPAGVENLLKSVAIKGLCLDAGVDKVEAGPKGAVVSFRNAQFANPAGLVDFITAQGGTVKLRPDHRLVYGRAWDDPDARLAGVQHLLGELAAIAAG